MGIIFNDPFGITPSLRSGVIPLGDSLHQQAISATLKYFLFILDIGLLQASPISNINKNTGSEPVLLVDAERGGFEPPVPLTQNNGFRDRRIRPLCHLSLIQKLQVDKNSKIIYYNDPYLSLCSCISNLLQ